MIKQTAKFLFSLLGLEVRKIQTEPPKPVEPLSIDPLCVEVLEEPAFQQSIQECSPYTLLDLPRLANLWQLCRLTDERGSLVEIGSYRGGGALHLSNAAPNRKIWICESFRGFKTIDPEIDHLFDKKMFRDTSKTLVESLFKNKERNFEILDGFFPASAQGRELSPISFVHLDVDVYEATKRSLDFLVSRLLPRSLIVLDDYKRKAAGLEKAVAEFLQAHPHWTVLPLFPGPRRFDGTPLHRRNFMNRLFAILTIALPLSLFSLVYDCFLFFNELELLDIRLREMNDFVDYFVLVESVETFRGNPKPLYFQNNRSRFDRYKDKIIHVIIDERIRTENPWIREEFQRNHILQGLWGCKRDDIILISDLDEILRGRDISAFLAPVLEKKEPAVTAQHRFYSHRLNRLNPEFNSWWNGSVATTFDHFRRQSPQKVRERKDYNRIIPNMGWHFTSVGRTEQIVAKFEATSHQECDRPERKSPEAIQRAIDQLEIVPIDSTFPLLVQEQEAYYRQIGFID